MQTSRLFLSILFFPIMVLAQPKGVVLKEEASWVERVSFDQNAKPADDQAKGYYYLLHDEQEHIASQSQYHHYAYVILNEEGVQQMADLSFDFDPTYQKIIFHQLKIIRDGKTINKLTRNVKTIRREESMDRYLYDGTETAIFNLEDVRVGDIIEYSFTRQGYNPVFGNIYSRIQYFNTYSKEKYLFRLLAPTGATLHFKNFGDGLNMTESKLGDAKEYRWEGSKITEYLPDENTPDWFTTYAFVQISQYNNWSDVASWANGLFQISSSEEKQIQEIASQFESDDLEKYAKTVTRFVQDEIRYLGFESGLNSHKPHSPLKVYKQRFGDCKDKSFLLVSLLRARGINANPVLVNTYLKQEINSRLPSSTIFNHCVVQYTIDDVSYYIDPTINNQGGGFAATLTFFPDYRHGLVVTPRTDRLTEFPKLVRSSTREYQIIRMKDTSGPGILEVETTYSGGDADYMRSNFKSSTKAEIQQRYLDYYANMYPGLKELEDLRIEDKRGENKFVVFEKYEIPELWKKMQDQENATYFEIYPQSLETYVNIKSKSNRTSPRSLNYPVDFTHITEIHLPERWTVDNEDETIEGEGYEFTLTSSLNGLLFKREIQYRTTEDHVKVENLSAFYDDHQKMQDQLGFQFTYNATSASSTSEAKTDSPEKLMALGFFLLFLTCAIILVIAIYNRYDPPSRSLYNENLPIGGWLGLLAVGMCITPLRLMYQFFTETDMFFGETPFILIQQGNTGLGIFLVVTHWFNVTLILFSVLLVILFFQRRTSFPILASIFYGTMLVMVVLDNYVASTADVNIEDGVTDILRAAVAAAIWIPYLLISTRAKDTFVQRKNPGEPGPLSPSDEVQRNIEELNRRW